MFTLLAITTNILIGIWLTLSLKLADDKFEAFGVGGVLGITIGSMLVWILSLHKGFAMFQVYILFATVLLLFLGFRSKTMEAMRNFISLPSDKTFLIYFLIMSVILTKLALKLIFFQYGNLRSNLSFAYGDLSWHIPLINSFVEGQGFPPENPILAGQPLAYPFLSAVFGGWLTWFSGSIVEAIVCQTILGCMLMIAAYYYFMKKLSLSPVLCVVGVTFFFFGGAYIGWLQVFDQLDLFKTKGFIQTLSSMPIEYSGSSVHQQQLNWINPGLVIFFNQRNLLLGLPMLLTSLLLLLNTKENNYRILISGVIAGSLPLAHAHLALFALPALGLLLLFLFPWRKRFWFLVPATIFVIPSVIYYSMVWGTTSSHLGIKVGYLSDEPIGWIMFWLKNFGPLIPLSLLMPFMTREKKILILWVTAWIWFILGNLFQFSVWIFDNHKIFLGWYLFIIPCFMHQLKFCLRNIRNKYFALPQAIIIPLILSFFMSASLDYVRYFFTDRTVQLLSQKEISIAEVINKATSKDSIIIEFAESPNTHLVSGWAGRKILKGRNGLLWSHGINYVYAELFQFQILLKPSLYTKAPIYLLNRNIPEKWKGTIKNWEIVLQFKDFALLSPK